MPFRCTNTACRRLQASDTSPADCPDKLLCDFERVAVVHHLRVDGYGKPLGSKYVNEEKVLLKLGCESDAESPIATDVQEAVTCLACIKNFPPPKTPTEE